MNPDYVEVARRRMGDKILLLQGAAYRRVAVFHRDGGGFWNPGPRDLYKSLVKLGYVVPQPGDRPDVQWRVDPDGHRVRGWPLTAGVLPVTGGVTRRTEHVREDALLA